MTPSSDIAALKTALGARYEIEREIGSGGMATVFRARDVKHGRDVAIKVLRPEIAGSIGSERFLREIRLTAGLDHPNIVALLDSGELDGFSFYVLPFVAGESLRHKLHREKRLDVDEAVRIAREVAGALQYAHARGVIHRDVKPENILLGDGRARLADFGIAYARDSTVERLTDTGVSLGTPHYMSPEQVMGDRVLDARADVFSLGVVLYEMVTGEPPFSGSSAQAVTARILAGKVDSPQILRPTLSRELTDVILQALNREPSERFASADEFSRALGAAPRRSSIGRGTSRRVVRAKWVVTAIVVAGAGALLIRQFLGERAQGNTVAASNASSISTGNTTSVGKSNTSAPTSIVVTLRNRRAADLRPIVAMVLSSQGKVIADTALNALVISEDSRLIDDRVRLARQLDSAGTAAPAVRLLAPKPADTKREQESGKVESPMLDPVPPGKLRIALVGFANGSVGKSAGDLAPLRLAIGDMLANELTSAPEFQIVEIPMDAAALESGQLTPVIAAGRAAGAASVIVGNYMGDATGRLRLSARIADVRSGAIQRHEVVEGRQDSVFAPIVALSRRLRCALDTVALRQSACGGNPDARAVRTKLDASTMKIYSRALDAFDAGDSVTARRLLNQVLSQFPLFEPALRKLDNITGAKPTQP